MKYNLIIEGNSLDILKKLDSELIDIVITSPPYNAAHDYDNYDDNLGDDEYIKTMTDIFKEVHRVLKKDGRICINVPFAIKNRETKKVKFLAHQYAGMLNSLGFNDFEWITWHKGRNKNHFQGNNTAWGSWKSPSCPSFRPMGEAVMVFFKEERRMVRDKDNIDITGDEFKNWTKNLWYFDEEGDDAYENLLMIPNTASKKNHPAPYPVELVERLLKLYSYEECIVLDPFNGIGTTTLAASNLNRKFLGIDLSKKYSDIAFNRIEKNDTRRITTNNHFSKLVNSGDSINSLNEYFPYKESFSPKLYDKLIERYTIENKDVMYDPFLGTGSSLLNSEVKRVFGVDVSPFAINVSKVKLEKLNVEEINKAKDKAVEIKKIKINEFELPNWKPYTKYVCKDKFNIIKSIINDFYSISNSIGMYIEYLIYSNLEQVFDYKRDGNGIKYRESKLNSEETIIFIQNLIIDSLDAKYKFDKSNSIEFIGLENKSSLDYNVTESLDLVITSPPYANMFDYFEVYKMELWTSGIINNYKEWRKLKKSSLRSNLNADINENQTIDNSLLSETVERLHEKGTDKKTIAMVQNYFYDMKQVINNLYDNMNEGGYLFIVVGNSFYSGIPIITDYIITDEAEKIGFKNEDIIFARKLRTSPQQMRMLTSEDKQYLRESIIVLKK